MSHSVRRRRRLPSGVPGVLYNIAITPRSLSASAGDSATTFSALGTDYFGSFVAVSGTWEVVTGVGTINSSTGAYTPGTTSGSATVRFTDTATGKYANVEVTVSAGAATSISLTPATVSVDEGGTQEFVAVVLDTYGNDTGLSATLSAVRGSFVGSTYTAPGTAGSDTVTASYTGLTDATASVTITAVVDHVTVTAASDAPTVGATDTFTATAYDAANNPITGVTVDWGTSAGTIDSSGVLTCPTVAGTVVTVTATVNGVSGTHNVTTVPDVPFTVTPSPSSATVVEGGTQTFTATVKDQYNNVRTGDTVTWSIAGQNVAYAVAVSPSTVSVALNGTQAFTATVTDVYGNTLASPSVSWSATSGSFTGSTYTAPASGTSDTVTATSGSASGTAAVTLTGGAATLTSPTGAATGATTASGTVSTNTGSGTLYWVASTSAVAPSVAQIQLGHDQSGSAAPASGNQTVSATGSQSISATGLTAGMTYYLYYQQHTTGGDSTVVGSASFTTVAIATLSSPTGTQTGSTTASGTVSTTQGTGTLYWVMSTSATPPSVAQIQLGNDSSGSTAAAHGSQSVSATGSQSISATGLTASTTYYAYYQQNDSAGDSTVVSSTSFTTSAGGFTSIAGVAFRATAGYVTDAAGDTYCLAEVYPVTRSASGGDSATFGWTAALADGSRDRSLTVDPRLAGLNQVNTGSNRNFRLHLPDGAATYSITLAAGDTSNPGNTTLTIKDSDNTTVLGTTGGAFTDGHVWDASNNLRTDAAWVTSNTPLSVSVTGSDLYVNVTGGGGFNGVICYLKVVRTA